VVTVIDALRARAARAPEHLALVAEARGEGVAERVSYGALVERMEAVASRLRGAGVAAGDRCGLVAPQGVGFVEHALGVLAADACLVPIADDLGAAGFEQVRIEARLQHALALGEGDARLRSFDAPPAPEGDPEAGFRALRPAYLRFTSGTTSRRKGVVLGHATVQARLDAANAALEIGPEDRVLWLLPMAHHFVVSILLYLREGATVLLPASSLARPALALAQREGATVLYASPFHHHLLAKDASEAKLPELRLAVSTAEGLRGDVARAFAARFGQPLVQALGVIECGLPVMNRASAARKPEALGRPLPGYEVWLRGEDGLPVAARGPEHTGELCIRGPGLFDAYLSPWTPAAAALAPDGFRTGDQAWIDEDGDLHLAGRRANRINLAGMKFFCEEVEAVLDAHPAVARSRVSARVHPHLGEIPVAEVVPADPAAPLAAQALQAFCRERLPSYKVPREIRVVAALETTATGKLVRWSPGGSG
jgi:long-chain acyl-CoA synthetase